MSHPKKVNPNIVLGARVQVDSAQGARGCVRYIGPVHSESEKSGKIWVGVEWDEIGRGKHDGTLDGVRYFSCSPLQGSFVHPARLMMGVTVKTALQSKYNEASIKGTIRFVRIRSTFRPTVLQRLSLSFRTLNRRRR